MSNSINKTYCFLVQACGNHRPTVSYINHHIYKQVHKNCLQITMNDIYLILLKQSLNTESNCWKQNMKTRLFSRSFPKLNDNLYSRLLTHAIIVDTDTTPIGDFHTTEINFRLIHCFQTAKISFPLHNHLRSSLKKDNETRHFFFWLKPVGTTDRLD